MKTVLPLLELDDHRDGYPPCGPRVSAAVFTLFALTTVLGIAGLLLVASLPGTHAFGMALFGALTLISADITWAWRPTRDSD